MKRKKEKREKYTKKQTKITTYNNKLGSGLITYTPTENNNNGNNRLVEAILNKDNKIIPLITKLIENINDNNNINNTEENLTNRQIVKYLNYGQYSKLKAFYLKVEEDFDRLEYEINEDKKNIEILDRQKKRPVICN